jgi:hypothetical protein
VTVNSLYCISNFFFCGVLQELCPIMLNH